MCVNVNFTRLYHLEWIVFDCFEKFGRVPLLYTASSYLAFAVLARPVALLLVAVLTFFLDDVRVDVFFVVDRRVGVLLLLVFVDLAVTGSSADVDAATFFLVVVEVRLVVFGSVDVASTFSVDEGVFLRVARSDLFPSC